MLGVGPGQQIDRFLLREKLGEGGYATVWAVRDGDTGEELALKVLKYDLVHKSWDGPAPIDRFLAEAELLARLAHPGMVRVTRIIDERERGLVAFAMERLVGSDLLSLSRSNAIELPLLLEVLATIAHTLGHLHDVGVIHRDVKQSNIFVCKPQAHPGQPVARLLDFGIAKQAEEVSAMGHTRTGELVGTAHALPPEVLDRASGVDVQLTGAVDQWGLGIVLYKCLTGKFPFDADDYPRLVQQIRQWPPPVMQLKPHFGLAEPPAPLDTIVRRALAKRPDARYGSAHRMGERISLARAELCQDRKESLAIAPAKTATWRGPQVPIDMSRLLAHAGPTFVGELDDADSMSTIPDPRLVTDDDSTTIRARDALPEDNETVVHVPAIELDDTRVVRKPEVELERPTTAPAAPPRGAPAIVPIDTVLLPPPRSWKDSNLLVALVFVVVIGLGVVVGLLLT